MDLIFQEDSSKTKYRFSSVWLERLADNQDVVGSIPTFDTTYWKWYYKQKCSPQHNENGVIQLKHVDTDEYRKES